MYIVDALTNAHVYMVCILIGTKVFIVKSIVLYGKMVGIYSRSLTISNINEKQYFVYLNNYAKFEC